MTIHQPDGTLDILALHTRASARERRQRIGAAAAGLAFASAAVLSARTAMRVLLGVAGGLLIARGLSGLTLARIRAFAKHRFSQRTDLERRFNDGEHDIVDAASFDSFPASDPPSYSPGTG